VACRRKEPITHSAYNLVETTKGGCEGFTLVIENPNFRLTHQVRKAMNRAAKKWGLNLCFRELHEGGHVYLSENVDKRMRTPFDERVHRFARHFAHGGEHRQDTLLEALVLAG
jgi:hypothetical protein